MPIKAHCSAVDAPVQLLSESTIEGVVSRTISTIQGLASAGDAVAVAFTVNVFTPKRLMKNVGILTDSST